MSESMVTAEDVLRFWLGQPGEPPLAKASLWWKKDDAFDREIKDGFEETLEGAVKGELSNWRSSPRGRLGLVIALDQFSRNMFRGTARSFAQDGLAREVATLALDAGDHRTLTAIEATFLLMPFMHAEDVALQRRCEGELTVLRDAATDEAVRSALSSSVTFAARHRAIIERFGRFPHRNAVLGRPSTPEEDEFLTQPGSSF